VSIAVIGRKLLFLRVFAVGSVAIAAGHFVQSSRHFQQVEDLIAVGSSNGADPSFSSGPQEDLPFLSDITSVAGTVGTLGQDGCAVRLTLAPAPGAMIDLALSAPCNLGERVVVRHSGLSFTASIGGEGQLRLQLPALEADALVATYLEGAEIVLAKVMVPDASDYFRFAVQMPYPSQFDLRAKEGEQVYVSGKASLEGNQRRILSLGSLKSAKPMVAQVYSVLKSDLADPELIVEVRISSENCGTSIPAETILSNAGAVSSQRLDVEVPPCGASGDILLLKNLLADLTLTVPE
jgi:hypothetical protein